MKLIYSTGNYIQYLIITYNEKESEKEPILVCVCVCACVCVCVAKPLCCPPETNTVL